LLSCGSEQGIPNPLGFRFVRNSGRSFDFSHFKRQQPAEQPTFPCGPLRQWWPTELWLLVHRKNLSVRTKIDCLLPGLRFGEVEADSKPAVSATRTSVCSACAMKTRILPAFVLLAASFCLPVTGAESPTPKPARPAIYDEKADGSKQIADALAMAKKENKRVLLQFGANWCGWCHKLHKLFEANAQIAARLKESYVVVLVDVNKGHNDEINQRYGNPTRFGLPVIVVLDADGKALITQDTGKLEEGDHHSPAKVLAFLSEWAGKKS
jgi:thiol-disulfide isomerase/thioredoxin